MTLPPRAEPVYTVAEVAFMLRVAKMTVYRMCHNGTMPSFRVGKSFRIRKADFDEYLRQAIAKGSAT